jgi:hypothetical protein
MMKIMADSRNNCQPCHKPGGARATPTPPRCVLLQAVSSQLEVGGWREVAIPVTSLGEGNNYHATYTVYCCRQVAASWSGEAGVRWPSL